MNKINIAVKNIIKKNIFILSATQLLLSVIFGAVCLWKGVNFLKNQTIIIANSNFNPWVYPFFHPTEYSLPNYLFLCLLLALVGILIYILNPTKIIKRFSETVSPYYLLISLVASVSFFFIFFIQSCFVHSDPGRLLGLFFPALIAIVPFVPNIFSFSNKYLYKSAVIVLFLIIVWEVLRIFMGPVYIMNEYPRLYGKTLIEGRYVDNKDFLEKVKPIDKELIKLAVFYRDKNKYKGIGGYYKIKKYKNLRLEQNFINLLNDDGFNILIDNFIKGNTHFVDKGNILELDEIALQNDNNLASIMRSRLRQIDVENIRLFYVYNMLEYYHQDMGRGQINHIGYVLNPLNEYSSGKPLKELYMQYGLGNTLLMKWTMGLFGGMSIQNYYKCYIYYIIYFILAFFTLQFLFRNIFFSLASFAAFTYSLFGVGFLGFILAPGIIPTIHFFDIIVLTFLILFFKRNNKAYLTAAFLSTALAIFINAQFGAMLMLACFISFTLYILENKKGNPKLMWLATLFIALILNIALLLFLLERTSSLDIFKYLVSGFLSWPAHFIIIFLTIVYLIISYAFMFLLKRHRFYLKYIYAFFFIYTQFLFVYYYWSGLPNHLPMVIPFLCTQLFLMLFILRTEIFGFSEYLIIMVDIVAKVFLIIVGFLLLISIISFYREKNQFEENFAQHRLHHWDFERAKVLSTVDPVPIEDSITLINKYVPQEEGVYIISKYDNLIPFLAKKPSLMPFSEMAVFLISKKESDTTIQKIERIKPRYIFVDNDISENINDPWGKLFSNNFINTERAARYGRYMELKKLFDRIIPHYKKIFQGKLLSVYERIPGGQPKDKI